MKCKAIRTLYRLAFAPARKPYQIGPLFTYKNGDFGAISLAYVKSQPASKLSIYGERREPRKNARVSGKAARGALPSPFAWLSRDFSRLPRACSQGNQICPYKTAPQSVSRMRLLGWVNLQRGTFQTRMYTFFNNLN